MIFQNVSMLGLLSLSRCFLDFRAKAEAVLRSTNMRLRSTPLICLKWHFLDRKFEELRTAKKNNTTVSDLKIIKCWSSDERFTSEPLLITKVRSSMRPASNLRDVRLTWSSHLKLHNLKVSLRVRIRRETQWNPRQTSETRGSHEVRIWITLLRKFSKCWNQIQSSVKPAFNK